MKRHTKIIIPLVIGMIVYFNLSTEKPLENSDQDSINEVPEVTIKLPKSDLKKIKSKVARKKIQTEPAVGNTPVNKAVDSEARRPKEIGSKRVSNPAIPAPAADPLWMRDTFYRDQSSGKKFLLTEEDIKRDFPTGLPREINITKKGKTYRLIHPNRNGTGEGQGKTFYAVDEETIDQKVAELNKASGASVSGSNTRSSSRSTTVKTSALNSSSNPDNSSNQPTKEEGGRIKYNQISEYNASFIPGYTDQEQTKQIQHPGNIYDRIVKTDYSLSEEIPGGRKVVIDPFKMSKAQKEALEQISKSLLSLGHGGTLSLSLYDYDELNGGSNDRIIVYENPFKIKKKSMQAKYGDYFYELAYVEVGNSEGKRHRFPCNLKQPYAKGSYCAGTIPTNKGGNKFFLKQVKSKKLKDITLVNVIDTGKNILPAAINREDAVGADIDSVILQKED